MEMRTHQIVFRRHGPTDTVSCQCRASEFKHSRQKGGGEYYEPFEVKEGQTFWQAYNDPANHWVEFTDKDKVRV